MPVLRGAALSAFSTCARCEQVVRAVGAPAKWHPAFACPPHIFDTSGVSR